MINQTALVKIHVPGLKKKINHYTTKTKMSSKVT